MPQISEKIRWMSTTVLTAFGQVMRQRSALTGMLFVVAIACNSWLMLCGAILGNVAAHLGAMLLRSDRETTAAGICGFNGTLVGIVLSVLLTRALQLLVLFAPYNHQQVVFGVIAGFG